MDIEKIFVEKNALLNGHFILSSGLHSDKYIQCALVLHYPNIADILAGLLVEQFRKIVKENISAIVSPAVGGIVVGQEVAGKLKNCRAIFCERENGIFVLRRGFQLDKTDNIIVVEDVITTGGSTNEVIELAKKYGAQIKGVMSLVDRSGGKVKFDVPKVSLLNFNINSYKPEECPLCKKNIPLVKPGSKGLK